MSEQYYFVFAFFKVDPKWRWMADLAKTESANEVANILRNLKIQYRAYSNLGLRDDADFMLWFVSQSIDEIQLANEKMYQSVFGKYVVPSLTYLSCTRPSIYVQEQKPLGFVSGEEPKKYVIVYPFTKTREWYLLSKDQRQDIMDEHIRVSKKYPQIILNTTYSFGIHDQDFMLAFEVDDIRDFQDLIMELRETRVSKYVKNDVPMIVGIKRDIVSLITSLG